jgi:biopolymer transport protein ExbD
MAGSAGGGKGEPVFQVAPMVDVLLVLLIFFMSITSAQVLKVDKSITLPIAADAIKADTTRSQAIVNVRWDETARKPTYVMNDMVMPDMAAITKALVEAKKSGEAKVTKGPNPTFRCVIRGDRMATAKSVTDVMNAAANAGISDVTISALNHD